MSLSIFLLWAACFLSFVLGAPAPIDNATLLQNGLDAQALNAEFLALSVNDACTSGQMACIDGGPALCQSGSWQVQKCSDSRECFAVPSIKERGTSLVCTSYANALSLIDASGAKGGITPANAAAATVPLPTMTAAASTPPSSATPPPPAANVTPTVTKDASPTSITPPSSVAAPAAATISPPQSNNDDPTKSVVTVTVTVSATPTITIPPVTTTISPAEAALLLSSANVRGALTKAPSPSSASVTSSSCTPAPTPQIQANVEHIADSHTAVVTSASVVSVVAPTPSATLVAGATRYDRRVVLLSKLRRAQGSLQTSPRKRRT
ncbi:hypothetical protein BXZ70DRAFT_906212 [Cristinia sonorae]|uniref:Uncharacterized protein n=1 Tax=Cristinia sonorae TaxID=1940300 RepID=A0A8K0UTJ3_9AGAR|nr:hypothetical protein BXZ70DRAFT_906212 [Cristinia sonorae]